MSFRGQAVQRTWHLVDASNQTVGRLAASIAPILRGKHKPTFSPNTDCGDYVVIVNAEKVEFSGRKWDNKLYRWHTGYPGGLKQRTASEMMEKKPDAVIRKAIIGMLARTNLRHKYIEPRLKVYAGPNHPHLIQLPKDVQPMKPVPRSLSGGWHYGLGKGKYVADGVYQEGRVIDDAPGGMKKK